MRVTRGFVFGGQGSAHPGFASEFAKEAWIESFFRRAELLSKPEVKGALSEYAFGDKASRGPVPPLLANLALYTFQVGAAFALSERVGPPRAVTGHSFGEYAALVTSGILSFEQGFQAVLLRELTCEPPNLLGYLLVVRAPAAVIQSLLEKHEVYLANTNASDQFALALTWRDLLSVEAKLLAEKVPFRRLSVPQPYHSPFMAVTCERLELRLKQWGPLPDFSRAAFLSSVLQTWVEGAVQSSLLQQILRDQMRLPVDFPKQCRLFSERVEQVYEVSAAPALQSVLKQNWQQLGKPASAIQFWRPSTAHMTSDHTPAVSVSDSSRSLVNRVLSRVTGYQIEEIRLEHRFQEDLGIDSLKAMEILLQVSEELKVPLTTSQMMKLRTVQELAQWVDNPVRDDAGEVLDPAADLLGGLGPRFEFAEYEPEWVEDPLTVIASEAKQSPVGSFDDRDCFASLAMTGPRGGIPRAAKHVLLLVEADEESQLPSYDGWLRNELLVSRRSSVSVGFPQPSLLSEALSAFLRSLKKEGQLQFTCAIQFSRQMSAEERIEAWKREVRAGLHPEVCYDAGFRRKIKRWVPVVSRTLPVAQGEQAPTETYACLALGGARGILHALLLRNPIAASTALVVVGRSSPSSVALPLEQLRKIYRSVEYISAEVSNYEELRQAWACAWQKSRHLRVIHAAGEEHSGVFEKKSVDDWKKEWASRVQGCQLFVRLSREMPAEKIDYFSSVIACFGNSGQTVYSAAHAAATQVLQALPGTNWFWPPFDNLGMTEKRGVLQHLRNSGVGLLGADRAAQSFFGGGREGRSEEGKRHSVSLWSPGDLSRYALALQAPWEFAGREEIKFIGGYRRAGVEFSLDAGLDAGLSEHVFSGNKLLPAAAMLALFRKLSKKVCETGSRLRRFEIVAPLWITASRTKLRLVAQGADEVWSLQLVGDEEIARAVLEASSSRALPEQAVPRRGVLSVGKERIYGPDRLFHAGRFQVLKWMHAQREKNEGSAEVDLQRSVPMHLLGDLSTEILALDAAFQLLAVVAYQANGRWALPLGVETLEFGQVSVQETRFILVREGQTSGDTYSAEVWGLSETGAVCFFLDAARVRFLPRSQ